MTDRELLEKAAKAAGINVTFKAGDYFLVEMQGNASFKHWQPWNPLTDDGDALRLAVTLHIGLQALNESPQGIYCDWFDPAGNLIDLREPVTSDPYAATRRAIVRAAAALGEDK